MLITNILSNGSADRGLKAQAAIRLGLGIPMSLMMAFVAWHNEAWMAHGGLQIILLNLVVYVAFACMVYYLVPRINACARWPMVYVTAVLDQFLITAFMLMLGEYSGLFYWCYLFIIFGYLLRYGPGPMMVTQAAGIVGFVFSVYHNNYWDDHYIGAMGVVLVQVITPVYLFVIISRLRMARNDAQEGSRHKSELLSKLSHELRTPLSGIVGSAQLIVAATGDKSIRKNSAEILDLSRTLLGEIDGLLDSAKFEDDCVKLACAPVSIGAVMEQVYLSLQPGAVRKGIALVVDVDPLIKEIVMTDRHYLTMVMMNLGSNALKFTHNGKISITVRLLESNKKTYRLRFSVKDTGIGIEEDQLRNIFRPFYQVSQGSSRQYAGTGVGLSLARRIVQMMGAKLVVNSQFGLGSRFHFEVAMPLAPANTLQKQKASPEDGGKKHRILLVDDNHTCNMIVKMQLENDGHTVHEVYCGQEALAMLRIESFDFLLLDYNLGDMDGSVLLKTIAKEMLSRAPVFFITADISDFSRKRMISAGASDVFHKPFRVEQFIEAMRNFNVQEGLSESGATHWSSQINLRDIDEPPVLNQDTIGTMRLIRETNPDFGAVLKNAGPEMKKTAEKLILAFYEKDQLAVNKLAHNLSGAAVSVGAERLAKLMKTILDGDSLDKWPHPQAFEQDVDHAVSQAVRALNESLSDSKLTDE